MNYESKLWCDIPENEKASFLRSGRAWDTGIIARSIVEEIAQVYDRAEKAEARVKELVDQVAGLIDFITLEYPINSRIYHKSTEIKL